MAACFLLKPTFLQLLVAIKDSPQLSKIQKRIHLLSSCCVLSYGRNEIAGDMETLLLASLLSVFRFKRPLLPKFLRGGFQLTMGNLGFYVLNFQLLALQNKRISCALNRLGTFFFHIFGIAFASIQIELYAVMLMPLQIKSLFA